ncbi:GH39 family glycosyl hydrolase [Clostridium butyricum]|uniref:GH39 family glycosyl hydrolase n=1 Tax=Clostridium butyricum TaxID=1492 RepID=UPI002ABE461B|nr:helix-turn-helix domain-containing protein [Clostridium butyricum]
MGENASNMPGVEIQILRDIKEKNHFHSEIEVIFVISGSVFVSINDDYYELKNKDIILFNSSISHKIESADNALICRVLVSYKILAQFVKNGNYIFYCNSVSDKLHSYSELQNIMKRIIFSYLGKNHKTECLRYGLVYELLDNLIEQFQKDGDYYKYKKGKKENEQLQYIINYVNLNFQNTIHLSKLAKEMYTSQSTLSRFFKNHMGIYFGDFVNQVRLNYAVKDLIQTDKTITKISIDCGFSNPSTFSKIFQNEYSVSPTAYRKNKLSKLDTSMIQKEEIEAIKKDIISFQEEEEGRKISSKEIRIQAQINQGIEYKKYWNEVLNAGTAHNLIMANVQSHITYLVEQLKFEYVRIWNIFSYKLMIQRNSKDYNYNFNMVDIILDFLVNSGAKPFIDFGKKPDCAVVAEDETVYYEEEYIDFHNMLEWKSMFNAFTFHIIRRYGKEEIEKWRFEFSIDARPNRFCIQDDDTTFDEFFQYNFKFIKKNIPKVEIGGFGIVEGGYEKLHNWLEYCRRNGCVPDFVSILSFPYSHVESDDKYFAKRVTSHLSVAEEVRVIRKSLDKEGFEKCRLYITEWNNSLSSRNYLNDSCFRAAYVIKMIDELWNIPDVMSVWMCSDLVSSYYDTSRIANGGSGLITKDKIRKPVFYAFLLLNRMGDKFIEKGSNYIITSNGMNSYYILCFNFKEYSCDYYLKDENNMEPDDISSLFENDDDLKLNINLKGMPDNQRFIIKRYIVNHEHGSILNEWSKFQYERDIEGSDLKHLIDVCIPDITMEKQTVQDNILKISAVLKIHEISLINIYEDN